MQKNLLTYYKDLLKNNTYSADGLAKLEEAKNTAVENIYSKKTKAKAKKAKANGIKELVSIFTLGAEVTPDEACLDNPFKNPIYQTELEAILNYYRTVENSAYTLQGLVH